MTLIDRLLMREVFKALLVTLLILMLVLLASHFVKLLGKAAAGSISSHVVLSLLGLQAIKVLGCLLYTSPSPRDDTGSRMPSSA